MSTIISTASCTKTELPEPICRHLHGALITAICLSLEIWIPSRARNQNSPMPQGVVEIKIGNKNQNKKIWVILEPLYARMI